MLSLYFHVPFCLSKCDYCSFFSKPYQKEEVDLWFTHLKKQIPFFLHQLRPKSIATIYWGGGTPSLIAAPYYEALFELLFKSCSQEGIAFQPEEISIEANPSSLSFEWIEQMGKIGLNRLTIGVQTFDPSIRAWMGRYEQNQWILKDLKDKLLLAGKIGMRRGIDLICGYPQQDQFALLSDLETALQLPIEHLSLYRLILEDSVLAKRVGELDPNILSRGDEAQLLGEAWLKSKGFFQYEISNFALKGYESIHNQVYWKMQSSLGFAPSAVSTLNHYCEGRLKGALRLSVSASYRFEVQQIPLPELIFERLMMGLRMNQGVDLIQFQNDFGFSPSEIYSKSCQKAIDCGWLICTEKEFRLSEVGMNFSNSFLVNLLEEADSIQWGEFFPLP